ncbi:MAG: hypothetical protein EA415_06220 [Sphaerobacteraceae bacterium]|nr:MAG: hypothetical protein EA415_06220 [Sphaerobacteraceae bacterium]
MSRLFSGKGINVKIKSIRAVVADVSAKPTTKPRVEQIPHDPGFVSPMERYTEFTRHDWTNKLGKVLVIAEAEDGTWGLGMANHGAPVVSVINDHFAPLLEGQDAMAIDKCWDMMRRASSAYGTYGIASYAISGVDTALWDLKGKLLGIPVYELLGGPQKEEIYCYGSNVDQSYGYRNSIEWFLELGFTAVKLFLRNGPVKGIRGINEDIEQIAWTRERVGDDVEIMVDAWMSLDVEYAVRLAEELKPYRVKWLEDPLLPEDMGGYRKLRSRVPSTVLATGEHWYTLHPFAEAASEGLIDIFQPDILWVGGVSAVVRICHIAEAHGLNVITHAGMNYPYGQHVAMAMPAIPMGERSEGVAPPGVPLEEMVAIPGTVPIKNGHVRPTDAPGFGFEVTKEWVEERARR